MPSFLDIRTLRLSAHGTPSARIAFAKQVRKLAQVRLTQDNRASIDQRLHKKRISLRLSVQKSETAARRVESRAGKVSGDVVFD